MSKINMLSTSTREGEEPSTRQRQSGDAQDPHPQIYENGDDINDEGEVLPSFAAVATTVVKNNFSRGSGDVAFCGNRDKEGDEEDVTGNDGNNIDGDEGTIIKTEVGESKVSDGACDEHDDNAGWKGQGGSQEEEAEEEGRATPELPSNISESDSKIEAIGKDEKAESEDGRGNVKVTLEEENPVQKKEEANEELEDLDQRLLSDLEGGIIATDVTGSQTNSAVAVSTIETLTTTNISKNLPPQGRSCRYPNCTRYKKSKSDGYCQTHYKLHGRSLAELEELLPKGVAPPGRGCRMEGCSKYRKAKCDGYCLTCYRNNGGNCDDETTAETNFGEEKMLINHESFANRAAPQDGAVSNPNLGEAMLMNDQIATHRADPQAVAVATLEQGIGSESNVLPRTLSSCTGRSSSTAAVAKAEGEVPTPPLSFPPSQDMNHDVNSNQTKPAEPNQTVISAVKEQPQLPSLEDISKTLPSSNIIKSGKFCNFDGCTKYKQSGCYGYCLTHVKFADPVQHSLQKQLRNHNSSLKKKNNKRYLCKWEGCEKYIQSNCHGYCLTHVKFANYEAEDGVNVTKVRVRMAQRLQNGFCQAVLPVELRERWGFNSSRDVDFAGNVNGGDGGRIEIESAFKNEKMMGGDDNDEKKPEAVISPVDNGSNVGSESPEEIMMEDPEPRLNGEERGDELSESSSAMDIEHLQNEPKITAEQTPVKLDFEVHPTAQRKSNGAPKCRAVGCPKNSQSHSHGFCRAHHNRYLICTGQCSSWDCVCGEKIASFRDRCGVCHRWRGGKHSMNNKKDDRNDTTNFLKDDGKLILSGKRKRKPGGPMSALDSTKVDCKTLVKTAPSWECSKCHVSNPGSKRRCGGCLSWKGTVSGGSSKSANVKGGGSNTARDDGSDIWANEISSRKPIGSNTSWECKQCNFDNFATELQCFMCQAVRPNWQWLKMYQSKSTIHAAGAESASVATRSPQDALVKADNDCKSADSTIQNHNADAISYITGQPTSFSTTGNNAEYNYYGDCSDGISYAHISIHYDFNQAYYKNHDYSYLNQGINSNRKYSNSGNNNAISGGNIRSSGVNNMREKVESN